jgi:ATP/maltotriose-dependent transcriptional regulator MalT
MAPTRRSTRLHPHPLETSVLERLSGELCDAVTGRSGGQATLEEVERSNLLVVPLDAERRWWRYHHLFADLLRVRLQQEQPDRVAVLHHRAAAWLQARDLADDAVRYALAAGDVAMAGRLVERHVDELLLRSERVTLARWLATTALARAYHAELRGDLEKQIAFGRRAPAECGEDDLTLGAITRGHLGVAEWLRGDLRESERALAASVRELCAAGQRFLAVRICEHLGQVRRARGDLDTALATYQQAMEIAAPPDQTPLPAAGIVHVRMAEVAYQRNHLDTHLAPGEYDTLLDLLTRFTYPPTDEG